MDMVDLEKTKVRKNKLQNRISEQNDFEELLEEEKQKNIDLQAELSEVKAQLKMLKTVVPEVDTSERIMVKRYGDKSKRSAKKYVKGRNAQRCPDIPNILTMRRKVNRMDTIPKLIDHVMGSGFYTVNQAHYIFRCINENVPEDILKKISLPNFSPFTMDQIRQIFMNEVNSNDIRDVTEQIIFNARMSDEQKQFILSCVLNGDPLDIVRCLIKPACPVKVLQHLRIYKLKQQEEAHNE